MALRNDVESLGSGYYWVGSRDMTGSLQCNPYLLVEGDEAVLFDPGSALDVAEVAANIASIIPLGKVKYVVLSHQDPDLASAVPRLEALGMRFSIVTHWRTWSLVRFYQIQSPPYMVDEHGYILTLASGRILRFIPAAYLHAPGSVAIYDKKAKYLLSSDLFGAFTPQWSLYAGEGYMEGMKTFHEHYMPSSDLLRPLMEIFSCLDLLAILPQHGSIIDKDIKRYIEALRNLECGILLGAQQNNLGDAGEYRVPAEQLLARFSAVFDARAAETVSLKLGLVVDPKTGNVLKCPLSGLELWNGLAESIYLICGRSALIMLEPFVAHLCGEFSIKRPEIYTAILRDSERNFEALGEEVAKLRQMNDGLIQAASQVSESQTKDTTTGLYNETFFHNFIDEQASLTLNAEGIEDDVLAIIGIDEGMARIEYQYGPREVEAILKGVSRIMLESKTANQPVFRLHGATFALWMPRILFHEANDLCEKIRKNVQVSRSFIEPVTISIGLVAVAEIRSSIIDPAEAGSSLSEIGLRRLRLARKRGGDMICSSSEVGKEVESKAKILIIDDDSVNAGVIGTFLENADYAVVTAEDGDEALKKIGEEAFDLIISELMVPKIDGLMVKEALSRKSGTKDIPFILLSHRKDEQSVSRAYKLGIDHYLSKPYLLAELLGIVQNMTSAGAGR
ncbi:MAG TPA: response regulator [Rectinemataceae bacterium]|nr:response regulator [Rectinemataceae bacterium]